SDSYSYSSSKSESYTEYSRYDSFSDGNAHSNSSVQGNTEASPDSASSAVTLSLRTGESENRRIGEWANRQRPPRIAVSPFRRFLFLAIHPCPETKLGLPRKMRTMMKSE